MLTLDRRLALPHDEVHGRVFVTQPEAPGRYPLLFLLMDAPGVRPELFAMARRLATFGCVVAVPDLYRRTLRDPQAAAGLAAGARTAMYHHMNALTAAQVIDDLRELRTLLAREPQIDTHNMGVIGYCMSGPFAIQAAAAFGQTMRMAASIHGVRLFCAAQRSAHRVLGRLDARLYVATGTLDPWAPPALVDGLERSLREARCRYRLARFADAGHGFVFPGRPAYQRAAAQAHWADLAQLRRQALPPPADLP
ncbi:MAG: dienelactone hydrolase family protein [Pseudomonadota bacterium]